MSNYDASLRVFRNWSRLIRFGSRKAKVAARRTRHLGSVEAYATARESLMFADSL